jgi:hypothetical protein
MEDPKNPVKRKGTFGRSKSKDKNKIKPKN